MNTIVLDLKINGIDVSMHDVVVTINGHALNSKGNGKIMPTQDPSVGFGAFINQEVELLAKNHRIRSSEIRKYVLKQFMQWRDGQDIAIDNVTAEVMERYEAHLRSRDLSLNTVSFNMRVLRSCYNKAIEKFHLTDNRPFKNVYTGIAQTDKRALSIDDIKKIKWCHTTDRDELFARDMFMFSFYTRGMSFVDMAYLKPANIKSGCLHYKRHKTGQSITVKWEQCMMEIVNRYQGQCSTYLLPIIQKANGKERNQYRGVQGKVNKALKGLAKRCGISKNLTMYVARHSWANAANTLNYPLELISYAMGHTSVKTTKIYLNSIDMSKIDQLNTTILCALNSYIAPQCS
jgi:site-specific recombinase XerD